jgi:hypothetical protein
MANYDRSVAIRTILKVFNDEQNKKAFERMLYDKAAENIEQYYKEFVVPIQPRDMKLEVEGVLGIADIRSILGEAVTCAALDNAIEVDAVVTKAPSMPITQPLSPDEDDDTLT